MTLRSPRSAAGPLLAASTLAAFLPLWSCRRRATAPEVEPEIPVPTHPAPASAEASGYDFRPAEKAAVDAFLRENPNLRVARDDDRRPGEDEGDLRDLYGVYHPYFVRGDANDDGLLDFVLGFARRDSDPDSPWFTVVLFSGRPGGAFASGIVVERDISLADGDLSMDRDSIVVTPDSGDDAARRYRCDPAGMRHVFVHDTPEEPASPPPAQI